MGGEWSTLCVGRCAQVATVSHCALLPPYARALSTRACQDSSEQWLLRVPRQPVDQPPQRREAKANILTCVCMGYEGCQAPFMLKAMAVTKVAGDGDCLFHALAVFDAYDGGALRIDVAEYMEAHARDQAGYEGEWIREAKRLRASEWGGHTVITAYSLMKQAKVVLHTHRSGEATTTVEEVCHMSISSSEAVRTVHILYNGVDHYDALVEITNTEDMVPAWPQPPPPVYFSSPADDFPPLTDTRQGHDNRSTIPVRKGFTAPRPAKKKSNAKRAAKKKPAASKTSRRAIDAEVPSEEAPAEDLPEGPAPAAAPPRADEEEEDETSHPHRQGEDLAKDREGKKECNKHSNNDQ